MTTELKDRDVLSRAAWLSMKGIQLFDEGSSLVDLAQTVDLPVPSVYQELRRGYLIRGLWPPSRLEDEYVQSAGDVVPTR